MAGLALSVVTPTGVAFEQQVDEVTVPGIEGEFGILPGHIAVLSATRPGVLAYRAGGERGRLAIDEGFAECDGKDRVVILARRALPVSKIDRTSAESEEDKAWAQAQLDALRS